MSQQPNVLVSNGTCYSGPGKQMDAGFLPCGNDAFARQVCCGAGDTCLAHNACFGAHGPDGQEGTLLTYIAGCSDPNYRDGTCPNKNPYSDQPWTGLVKCGDSDDWVACSQSGSPSTLRQGEPCTCPSDNRVVAFTNGPTLTSSGILPTSAGGSVAWFTGHIPTQPPPPPPPTSSPDTTTKPPTTKPSPTTFTSGGSTFTSTPPTSPPAGGPLDTGTPNGGGDNPGPGLSTGAKAGIGVGASLAGLAVLAALAFLFLLRRRKASAAGGPGFDYGVGTSEVESALPPPGGPVAGGAAAAYAVGKEGQRHSAGLPSSLSTTPGLGPGTGPGSPETVGGPSMVSELEPRAARPWSMRSELEGSYMGPSLAEYAEVHGGQVPVNTGIPGMAGTGAGTGTGLGVGHRGNVRSGELSPVSELP